MSHASKRRGGEARLRKVAGVSPRPSHARVSGLFHRFACKVSAALGTPWAFVAALALVVVWGALGPFFRFGEAWQLVINTATTIVTFVMIFLLQCTQNRDARAIQLKLDELIRSSRARNAFADLENASEEELDAFQAEFERLRERSPRGAT